MLSYTFISSQFLTKVIFTWLIFSLIFPTTSTLSQTSPKTKIQTFFILSWPGKAKKDISKFNKSIAKFKDLKSVIRFMANDPSYLKVNILMAINKDRTISFWHSPVDGDNTDVGNTIHLISKGIFPNRVNHTWELQNIFKGRLVLLDTIKVKVDFKNESISNENYIIKYYCKYNASDSSATAILLNNGNFELSEQSFINCPNQTYHIKLFNQGTGQLVLGDCDIVVADESIKSVIRSVYKYYHMFNGKTENDIENEMVEFVDNYYGKVSPIHLIYWLKTRAI